jgi:hypothetical protein
MSPLLSTAAPTVIILRKSNKDMAVSQQKRIDYFISAGNNLLQPTSETAVFNTKKNIITTYEMAIRSIFL